MYLHTNNNESREHERSPVTSTQNTFCWYSPAYILSVDGFRFEVPLTSRSRTTAFHWIQIATVCLNTPIQTQLCHVLIVRCDRSMYQQCLRSFVHIFQEDLFRISHHIRISHHLRIWYLENLQPNTRLRWKRKISTLKIIKLAANLVTSVTSSWILVLVTLVTARSCHSSLLFGYLNVN